MYLSFDEFIELGGGECENTAEFDSACRRAAAYIDYYTQGRLKKCESVPQGVKLAMFEICLLISEKNEDISSYSSDGVSVKLSGKLTFEEKIYEIIKRNVPHKFLYLGVEKNEH